MKRWPVALVCLMLVGMAGALLFSTALQGQSSSSPAMPKELTSYRDVVKTVLPAVVSIKSLPKAAVTKKEKATTPRRQRPKIDAIPGIPEEFRKFFEDMEEQGVDPEDMLPQQSFGSGFSQKVRPAFAAIWANTSSRGGGGSSPFMNPVVGFAPIRTDYRVTWLPGQPVVGQRGRTVGLDTLAGST